MKKPKNSSGDDFSFMDGGMDEFFPLENPGNKEKTPKGIKGYLKNVAKSVVNLGVKVNKSLYPDVIDLGSQFKEIEDPTGNSFDVKGTIRKYTDKAKNVYSEGTKIAKEIADDAKNAIKTGKFVKSEEESMDMSDMFGDMFGDDFGSSADFGDDFDDSDGDSGSKKGRISSSEATIKSSMASTKAILKSNQKQRAAIVGAAQSHIRHETELFSQQIQLSQYQHRQKMMVMKNIATNLGKVINQNNIKLKAQMEYSAKSLAFAQDTAAMIKEMRSAMFKMITPDTSNLKDFDSRSSRSKIFGGGDSFNINGWINQIKGNFKNSGAGGLFDMLGMAKDSIGMMTDMGMKKSDAIKQMVGGMIFDSVVNSAVSGKTRRAIDEANLKAKGAPAMLNMMLGKISRGDSKLFNKFMDWGNQRGGFLGTLTNFLGTKLQSAAGIAHVSDSAMYGSDRYKMGDPNQVHPFDNKAHKVLTEVIPSYLSKISAGVNHTQEEIFDYKLNRFIPNKRLQQRLDEAKNDAYYNIRNVGMIEEAASEFNVHNTTDLGYGSTLKQLNRSIKNQINYLAGESETVSKYIHDDQIDPDVWDKEIRKIIENLGKNSLSIDKETLSQTLCHVNKNGSISEGRYTDTLLSGTVFKTGYEKAIAAKTFYEFITRAHNGANKLDRKDFLEFQQSLTAYNQYITDAHLDVEERNSVYNNSISHDQMASKAVMNKAINDKKVKLAAIKKQLEAMRAKGQHINGNQYRKLLDTKRSLEEDILSLNKEQGHYVKDINSGLDSMESNYSRLSANNPSVDGFSKFRISSLEDDSTHGLVQNIYNLLLSGIDVYSHSPSDAPKGRDKYIDRTKHVLAKQLESKIVQSQNEDMQGKYIPLSGFCPEFDIGNRNSDFIQYLTTNDIINYTYEGDEKPITIKYTGKIYHDENGRKVGIKLNGLNPKDWIPNIQYYFAISEKRAVETKENRERKFELDSTPFWAKNKIGAGIYKSFNKVQQIKAGVINGFLGKALYGEEGNELDQSIGTVSKTLKKRAAKELSAKFQDIQVDGTKLVDVVSEINQNDKSFHAAFSADRDPKKQAEFLIKEAANRPQLQKFIPLLDDFVKQSNLANKSTTGAMSIIVNNMKRRFKDGVNKKLEPVARKLLSGKLAMMKVGKITLAGTIADINSETLSSYFKKEKDPIIKAKYLLDQIKTYPKLEPFKDQLEDFVKDAESTMSGPMGAAATLAMDKMNKIKGRLKNTGNKLLNKFLRKNDLKRLLAIKVGNKSLQDLLNEDSGLNTQVSIAWSKADKSVADGGNNNLAPYGEALISLNNEKLDPYKPLIQEWVESVKDRLGFAGNKAGGFIDKTIDKVLGIVDKFITGKDHKTGEKISILTPELAKLKSIDGTITLGEVIDAIAERRGEDIFLRAMPTSAKKAAYIIKAMGSEEELKPFLKPLHDFLEENKNKKLNKLKANGKSFLKYAHDKGIKLKGLAKDKRDELEKQFLDANYNPDEDEETLILEDDSIPLKARKKALRYAKQSGKYLSKMAGTAHMKINNAGEAVRRYGPIGALTGVLSSLGDSIKKKFNRDDDGPVKGDKAEEQKKLKLEKQKLKEEREDRKERKTLFKKMFPFLDKNKDGIKLDDKQAGEFLAAQAEIAEAASSGDLLGSLVNFVKNPSLKSGLKVLGNVGKGSFKGASSLLGSFVSKALPVAGAAAAGYGAYKLADSFTSTNSKSNLVYQGIKHDDSADWDPEKAAKQAENERLVLDSTAMGGGIVAGYHGTKYLQKGLNKVKGIAYNKKAGLELKAAEKLSTNKTGLVGSARNKLSDKMLNKAAKSEAKALKASKKGSAKVANPGDVMKQVGGGMIGSFLASTAASSIADKFDLSETQKAGVTNAAGVVGGVVGSKGIPKLLTKFFKELGQSPKVLEALGKKAPGILGKLLSGIGKCIGKIGAKLTAAVSKLSVPIAGWALIIVQAAAGLVDGMTDSGVKSAFGLSKHAPITWGMRVASGVCEMLNNVLLGILDTVANIFDYESAAEWVYSYIGGEVEKEALANYQEFTKMRAKIYGVTRDQLVAYEQRYQEDSTYGSIKNGVKSGIRCVGSYLAKGIAATINFFGGNVDSDNIIGSNDKYASDLLGFADKSIYLYWKDKKYDPIEEESTNIITSEMGSLEAFAEMITPSHKVSDYDVNGDGEASREEIMASEQFNKMKQQVKTRIHVLENMKKYVLDNQLAWLTNSLTLEEFNKYLEKESERGKYANLAKAARKKEEANAKAQEDAAIRAATPHRYRQEVISGNSGAKAVLAQMKSAEDAKLKNNTSSRYENTIKNTWTKLSNWIKGKYKEYKFNKKEEQIMDSATAAIRAVNTNVDPTYYGDNPAENIKVGAESTNGSTDVIHVGGNGGDDTLGTNEGYFVKVKTVAEKAVNTGKTTVVNGVNRIKKKIHDATSSETYDMSGATPKNTVMNSIVSDFAKNFGNDLIKRLNILEEMHKENLRHNKVTEDFFKSCLQMMVQIANAAGNKSTSSALDAMISQIVH